PQSLLDDVVRHALPSLVSIEIIGGEPLFYDETEALCAAAEQHPDLEIVMSTNATLLSEKWARRIAAGNYTLQVSIDGARPETYTALRGKSDFDKVIANVERARDLAFQAGKPWVAGLQFIIMRQNCHEIVEMVGLAQRLCAELHFNIVEYPHGDEALRGMDPLSDRSTAKRVLDLLREAHAAAQQAKVKLTTRAVPRIVNQYPSLIETPDEAWMLPLSAKHFSDVATNTVRNDLTIRDKVAVDDLYKRIERLRSQGRPKSEISYERLLPKLSDDAEHRVR